MHICVFNFYFLLRSLRLCAYIYILIYLLSIFYADIFVLAQFAATVVATKRRFDKKNHYAPSTQLLKESRGKLTRCNQKLPKLMLKWKWAVPNIGIKTANLISQFAKWHGAATIEHSAVRQSWYPSNCNDNYEDWSNTRASNFVWSLIKRKIRFKKPFKIKSFWVLSITKSINSFVKVIGEQLLTLILNIFWNCACVEHSKRFSSNSCLRPCHSQIHVFLNILSPKIFWWFSKVFLALQKIYTQVALIFYPSS